VEVGHVPRQLRDVAEVLAVPRAGGPVGDGSRGVTELDAWSGPAPVHKPRAHTNGGLVPINISIVNSTVQVCLVN
jgi:hypothetical protein